MHPRVAFREREGDLANVTHVVRPVICPVTALMVDPVVVAAAGLVVDEEVTAAVITAAKLAIFPESAPTDLVEEEAAVEVVTAEPVITVVSQVT